MSDQQNTITRKAFLQRLGLGMFSIAVAGHALGKPIVAKAGVTDNLPSGSGGVDVGNTSPANPNMLWINPDENQCGKFFDGTDWRPFTSQSYVTGATPPANRSTLWLNTKDGAMYWNKDGTWTPVNALWG